MTVLVLDCDTKVSFDADAAGSGRGRGFEPFFFCLFFMLSSLTALL